MIRESDVILTPLPQADGQIKNRPALLLRQLPPFNDWLVCGISTQLHQHVEGFDEIVAVDDSDFEASGLKAASIIRLGFLAVLPSAYWEQSALCLQKGMAGCCKRSANTSCKTFHVSVQPIS